MKAMILAAGFGTRLWPLTVGRTKPAIPFLGRPLIAYTIDYLRRYGITDVIINLHHEPASVRDQIGDGSRFGVQIHYSLEEPEILGTSGALDAVRDQLSDDTFVVINGKIITDLDLGAAIQSHRDRHALATLVLRPNPQRERFSEVLITPDQRVARFGGFPEKQPTVSSDQPAASETPDARRQTPTPPLMFTGIHVLDPGIFEYIPRGVFSDSVRDVYPRAMAEGKLIAAHVAEGSWYELSTLERYLDISLEFLRREKLTNSLGEGCEIAPGATVRQSILWDRVRVEPGASLSECVVGDDVTIRKGTVLLRCCIFRADRAPLQERPAKAAPGLVFGENLVVPLT